MTLSTHDPPRLHARPDPEPIDAPPLIRVLPPGGRRFVAAIWQRRGPLAAFVIVAALVATGVSLLLPKWFTAESTILPPTDSGESMGLMSAMMENNALSRLGLFTATTPSDVYAEILRSRTLRESLVRDFSLETLYRTKGMDRTLKELESHLQVSTTPIGVVVVRVEDRDPQRAANMTNHLVSELDRFNRESMNTRAKSTRIFLESRLLESRARLENAESTLTAYERRNKVVASSEGPAVSAMSEVISQKLNLGVRRSYMSSYTRPGSPALREVDAEIEAVDREIAKLPGLKQEGSRLALDSEIQRRVFTLLTAQYEDSRVQEMRNTPTLTVLDPARPPEIRSRPRRALIVIATILTAMMLGMAWVAVSTRGTVRA